MNAVNLVYLRFVLQDWEGLTDASEPEIDDLVQLLAWGCRRQYCFLQQSACDERDLYLAVKMSLRCSPMQLLDEFNRQLGDPSWNVLFNLARYRWSGKFYVVSYGEAIGIPDPLTHPFDRFRR